MQEAEFQDYLHRITDEDASSAMIEAGAEARRWLEEQFRQESSPERRTAIVRIIWEHRDPTALAFLTHALADPTAPVWQEALNGIVTLGGKEATALLHAALPEAEPDKRERIIAALGQL